MVRKNYSVWSHVHQGVDESRILFFTFVVAAQFLSNLVFVKSCLHFDENIPVNLKRLLDYILKARTIPLAW